MHCGLGYMFGPLPRLCLEWYQLHRIREIFAWSDPEVKIWVGSAGAQDKNHFTVFAENSLFFSCAQQFLGCHIVFCLPALACFEMWPGIVKLFSFVPERVVSVGRGATSQSSQHCLPCSISELGKSWFPGSLTQCAGSSSPTWPAFLSSRWRGVHCCGEMLFWEWVWRIRTVFIQPNYLFHMKLHPLLSGSCVDIPSFHLHLFARPHVQVEWWLSGWVKKNMLPVFIPGFPTLPMITWTSCLSLLGLSFLFWKVSTKLISFFWTHEDSMQWCLQSVYHRLGKW